MQLPSAVKKPIEIVCCTIRFTFHGFRDRVYTSLRGVPSDKTDAFLDGCGSPEVSENTTQGKAKRRFPLRFWQRSAIVSQKETSLETKEAEKKPARAWKVSAYSALPLKAMSRWWGKINDINLPVWARAPSYKIYAWLFGVDLEEMAEEDLRAYSNLGEFFYRELKPELRPIDENVPLVSPADGTVVQMGVITDGQIEQVKGITYSLEAFLGINCVEHAVSLQLQHIDTDEEKESSSQVLDCTKQSAKLDAISSAVGDFIVSDSGSLVADQGNATISLTIPSETTQQAANFLPSSAYKALKHTELYYSVIYLAPGDYHRFHSSKLGHSITPAFCWGTLQCFSLYPNSTEQSVCSQRAGCAAWEMEVRVF